MKSSRYYDVLTWGALALSVACGAVAVREAFELAGGEATTQRPDCNMVAYAVGCEPAPTKDGHGILGATSPKPRHAKPG